MALALSACVDETGGQASAGTIGSEPLAGAEGATPTTADEPWTTEAPGGPPIVTLASAADIRSAVEQTHGRTSDVSAEIRRFAPFPDIPTPDRARVEELRADVRDLDDAAGVTTTAEVAFTVDGDSDELVELYRNDFAARGWTESADRTGRSSGEAVRNLSFAIPDSAYALDDVLVTFSPAPPDDGVARTMVRMRYVEVLPPGDPIGQRLVGWAAGVPLPDSPVITSAGIHTSSVGRNTLHFSIATYYEALTPEAVAEALRRALPAEGYSERPTPLIGDATDNWVHLNNELFDKSWVSTQNIGNQPPSATNPTKVNIAARVDFSPAAP